MSNKLIIVIIKMFKNKIFFENSWQKIILNSCKKFPVTNLLVRSSSKRITLILQFLLFFFIFIKKFLDSFSLDRGCKMDLFS